MTFAEAKNQEKLRTREPAGSSEMWLADVVAGVVLA